jgi:ADP-ribose pyrophosphatase
MKRYKTISEEVIHDNGHFQYKSNTYTKENGKTGTYNYAETNGAVYIIPVMPDGRIVMEIQYRYLFDKESIELPAGAIESGQDTLDAAKAELKQETGCTASEWIKVGYFNSSVGHMRATAHVFLAQVDEQGEQDLDETEDIEVIYRRPDEIEEMIERNDVWDGGSIAAWTLVRHHFANKVINKITHPTNLI